MEREPHSHLALRIVVARSGPRWGSSAGSRKSESLGRLTGSHTLVAYGERASLPFASLPFLPGL